MKPVKQKEKPKLPIKVVYLDITKHLGKQLMAIREYYNCPRGDILKLTDLDEFNNESHIANMEKNYKGVHDFKIQKIIPYLRALGIQEVRFKTLTQ